MNGTYWIHNLDPVLLRLGGIEVRYYGFFFALAMVQGAFMWTWQIRRSGRSWEEALPAIWMAILGAIIGGHLGNILFYNLAPFLEDPLRYLLNWRGGFASHGSTVGVAAALYIYSRKLTMPYLGALDRCSLTIPLMTTCIRLGNFMNGEIVGKASAVPWAVIYPAYDRARELPFTPRHPSQLYEAAMGMVLFIFMFQVDRRLKENRPRGLMLGLFFAGYFSLRFGVEFFKEPHLLDPSFPLNMGQILSMPFAAIGWWLVVTRLETMKKAPNTVSGAE